MGDVLAFTPRSATVMLDEPKPMTEADIRTRLGQALQTALDAADHIIAVLDDMDGDADLEDDADTEPSLAAPENHHGSQVGWCRGGDADRGAEAPDTVLPEMAIISPLPKLRPAPPEPLPWGGEGSVIAAAGVALLALVVGG